MWVPIHYHKRCYFVIFKTNFKSYHYLFLNQTSAEVISPDSLKGQFWHQIKTVLLNFIASRNLHIDYFSPESDSIFLM